MPRSPEQRRRDDERGYVIGQIANGRSISNLHSTIDEIVGRTREPINPTSWSDSRCRSATCPSGRDDGPNT